MQAKLNDVGIRNNTELFKMKQGIKSSRLNHFCFLSVGLFDCLFLCLFVGVASAQKEVARFNIKNIK